MSKINELKQQNSYYGKSLIDILSDVFDKSKYVELAVNLIKNNANNTDEYQIDEIMRDLDRNYGIPKHVLEGLGKTEIQILYNALFTVGSPNVSNLIKFAEYNERKLVDKNDLSTYKSFEELETQLGLVELKLMDKELQAQTQVLYSADEWLVLKPLSYEASLKYGANTKWCTAMKHEREYFTRYSKRGIVIYCINRSTGEKIAAFKSINPDYEAETSFWNAQDARLDSMETNLPYYILSIIRDEFTHTTQTNWDLFPAEYKSQFELTTTKSMAMLNVEQPNVVANQGGLGLAIRRAITYDEAMHEPQLEPMEWAENLSELSDE